MTISQARYFTVGGAVRDELLGVKSKDIDFAVEASSYAAMRDDILDKGMVIFQERPEFLSIRGRHPTFGGVDFTLCRKEGFYSDSRHPDSVEIGTIFDDLARRDFTVNAIAKDEKGKIIDPHNGVDDLNHRLLKCVGNSTERFSEDPLRILRAIRFHIVMSFDLDMEIWNTFLFDRNTIAKLKTVSIERVYEELKKCYEADTWATIEFFKDVPYLESVIFNDIKLGLTPRIVGVK